MHYYCSKTWQRDFVNQTSICVDLVDRSEILRIESSGFGDLRDDRHRCLIRVEFRARAVVTALGLPCFARRHTIEQQGLEAATNRLFVL